MKNCQEFSNLAAFRIYILYDIGMQPVSLLGSSYYTYYSTCIMVVSPILKLVESSLKITVFSTS